MISLKRRFTVRVFVIAALAGIASSAGAATSSVEIFAISPAFSSYNLAGQNVTIKGVGFTASTTVRFDTDPAASVTRVDSRTLTVTVPVVASARISTVTVSDPVNGTDDFFPFFHVGPVLYVSTTGVDKNNPGTNPLTPLKTIAAALLLLSGSTPTEIRVEAGQYMENMLVMPNATVVSCGWGGGFAERDTDTHITELNGGGTEYIIRTSGLTTASSVDGCTLRNGLRDAFGGGAIPVTADNAVINNNVIVGNSSTTYGGGVYFGATTVYGGRVTVSNNVIVGNRSHGRGGGGVGVYTDDNNQQPLRIILSGNQIVGNRAYKAQGGGAAVASSGYGGYAVARFSAADNLFAYNSSLAGGGLDLWLQNFGDQVNLTVDNNLIVHNRSTGTGGGLSIRGLGNYHGRVTANTVARNAAGYGEGGGFLIDDTVNPASTIVATDLILWGNFGGDALADAITRTSYSDSGTPLTGPGNLSTDPIFTPGPLGEFYLRQSDPNGPDSPVVNHGSTTAALLSLNSLTTRADRVEDTGIADMGYHYPPTGTDSPDPISFIRIDPARGDINGNEWVLIRGKGFDPGAATSFDGIPAEKTIYLSAARVLAQPSHHAVGTVNLRVTNPGGAFVQANGAYTYADVQPPLWMTTVGAISAQTGMDCVRSVGLDWNDAVDDFSPPVLYEVYRTTCEPPINDTSPCANFGFVPAPTLLIATTPDTFYVDLNHPSGGGDPKYIYLVRARDSATPPNREYNFAKRVSLATAISPDLAPPAPVGNSLLFRNSQLLDWDGAGGAVSYGVYRTDLAGAYATPGTLTKLATLTRTNNDLNGDGITDTTYEDVTVPMPRHGFFYRITAIDPCDNETTSELLP